MSKKREGDGSFQTPKRPRVDSGSEDGSCISSATEEEVDIQPQLFDVLSGRGKTRAKHEGNIKYKNVIKMHTHLFMVAEDEAEKSAVVQQAVDEVKSMGRFLVQKDGKWIELPDGRVRRKVRHAIQDHWRFTVNKQERLEEERGSQIGAPYSSDDFDRSPPGDGHMVEENADNKPSPDTSGSSILSSASLFEAIPRIARTQLLNASRIFSAIGASEPESPGIDSKGSPNTDNTDEDRKPAAR